jgi:hypothetical protein
MAKVLAAEGQPDKALALLGLVLGYKESPRPDLFAFVKPLVTEFEAELPPEVLAAGLERGKSLDLETVIRELLAEARRLPARSQTGQPSPCSCCQREPEERGLRDSQYHALTVRYNTPTIRGHTR